MTAHYRKMKWIYFGLSAICLFGPILFFFAKAFVCGDAKQKLTLGFTFTVALILFVVNLIMKSHLRSVIWVLLLGVFCVFNHYKAIVIVFALTTFLEELIFSPMYRLYKQKTRINAEIDKRIGDYEGNNG